jgi:tetratricopeptide (TPR) repeat protein
MIMNSLRQRGLAIFSSSVLLLSLGSTAAWAGDPFRGDHNPSNIGDHTEAAFEAIFAQGDYRQALRHIQMALRSEGSDPLAPAIRASLAYNLDSDLETMQQYAEQTKTAAQALLDRPNASPQDQIRGNLYLAAGTFLDGVYTWETEKDYVSAALTVQEVFGYINAAERIDDEAQLNDPELNLVKGYIELLLSVNLPMSSPENAIAEFEASAQPRYLVDRGIAIAYRDIGFKAGKKGQEEGVSPAYREEKADEARRAYGQALERVNRSLSVTPDNPELFYLKAQILHELGKVNQIVAEQAPTAGDIAQVEEAVTLFNQALAARDQLPMRVPGPQQRSLPEQIIVERNIAQQWLAEYGN